MRGGAADAIKNAFQPINAFNYDLCVLNHNQLRGQESKEQAAVEVEVALSLFYECVCEIYFAGTACIDRAGR